MSRKPLGPSGDLACSGQTFVYVQYQVDNYHVPSDCKLSLWPGVSLLS